MISHRHGSSSSETGQYPASVTLSPEATADPNSNTVTSNGRRTSTAPFNPGTSSAGAAGFVLPGTLVSPFATGGGGGDGPPFPFHQESNPMGRARERPRWLGLGFWTDHPNFGKKIKRPQLERETFLGNRACPA